MTPGCTCSIAKRQPVQNESGSWYCKTCGYWIFGDWQAEQKQEELRRALHPSRVMDRIIKAKHRKIG